MTLYSIDPFQRITHTPHRREFEAWRSRLSSEQREAIRNELRNMIDSGTDRVFTSSWIPGSNWEGTVWQAIFLRMRVDTMQMPQGSALGYSSGKRFWNTKRHGRLAGMRRTDLQFEA